MSSLGPHERFEQLHIDVARNATDDFNPFHDPRRWSRIVGNPFGGPIVLGFQVELLMADRIARRRREEGLEPLPDSLGLHFINYELNFAGALRPGEAFTVDVRKTCDQTGRDRGLSSRAAVRRVDGGLVAVGTQSDTASPRFLSDARVSGLPVLDTLPDRFPVPGSPYFLKRKFMTTSNGKNFALAALTDAYDYFDELSERVSFPPIFPVALVSSALLEKAWRERYDFTANPLVYTTHQISIDRRLQRQLRTNDRLHILVEGPVEAAGAAGLGRVTVAQILHRCFGLVHGQQILFRANIWMAPLSAMVKGGDW
jgi:hypothetical protein